MSCLYDDALFSIICTVLRGRCQSIIFTAYSDIACILFHYFRIDRLQLSVQTTALRSIILLNDCCIGF